MTILYIIEIVLVLLLLYASIGWSYTKSALDKSNARISVLSNRVRDICKQEKELEIKVVIEDGVEIIIGYAKTKEFAKSANELILKGIKSKQ